MFLIPGAKPIPWVEACKRVYRWFATFELFFMRIFETLGSVCTNWATCSLQEAIKKYPNCTSVWGHKAFVGLPSKLEYSHADSSLYLPKVSEDCSELSWLCWVVLWLFSEACLAWMDRPLVVIGSWINEFMNEPEAWSQVCIRQVCSVGSMKHAF